MGTERLGSGVGWRESVWAETAGIEKLCDRWKSSPLETSWSLSVTIVRIPRNGVNGV